MNQTSQELADILHEALTARVDQTNKTFKWLVRNPNDEWKIYREEPGYNPTTGAFTCSQGTMVYTLRPRNTIATVPPLKFCLDDYRPSKLGTIKIAGGEIPHITGGGTVSSFIEDVIDCTYNWYSDNDVDIPKNSLIKKFWIGGGTELPTRSSQTHLESVAPSECGEALAEPVEEPVDDPFASLYQREPSARVTQWKKAQKLQDDADLESVVNGGFPGALAKAKQQDPLRFDSDEVSKIIEYFKRSVTVKLPLNVFEEEIPFMINVMRALPKKYCHIRRTAIGHWIAGSLLDEVSPIIFYYDPTSELCPRDMSTVTYELTNEFLRFNR